MLLARRLAWSGGLVLASCVSASLWACSACSSNNIVGTDYADASRDRLLPQPDVSIDDGALDEPDVSDFDGGYPFLGSWIPLPNAPKGCSAKVDMDPQVDIGDLQWIACPTARPGCRRLNVTWTTNLGVQIRAAFLQHIRIVQGTPYLAYERWFPAKNAPEFTDAIIKIVTPLDKAPIFAAGDYFWKNATACFYAPIASASGIQAVGISNSDPNTLLFLTSPFQNPQALALHSHTAGELGMFAGGTVQNMAALGPTMFLGTSNPFSITVYQPFTDSVKQLTNGPNVELPVAVKDGALAIDARGAHQAIALIGEDASITSLYTPQGAQNVFDIYADQTNGDALVWLQGSTVNDVALWTAPYASNNIVPRRVTGIPNGNAGIFANAGMAVVVVDYTTALLVRLSDGWAWPLPAEPGDLWRKPLWVDDNEVWLLVAPLQWNGGYQNGIVRLARATLGAPTIAPK